MTSGPRTNAPPPRQILLTRAEALVLSDWLERFEASVGRDASCDGRDASLDTRRASRVSAEASCDDAERAVLARIAAQLDEQLEELFDPNYEELLAKAKAELRGPAAAAAPGLDP